MSQPQRWKGVTKDWATAIYCACRPHLSTIPLPFPLVDKGHYLPVCEIAYSLWKPLHLGSSHVGDPTS